MANGLNPPSSVYCLLTAAMDQDPYIYNCKDFKKQQKQVIPNTCDEHFMTMTP